MISLQKGCCIHETMERDVRLCPTVRNFTEGNPIVPPAFLIYINNKFENCSVCGGEAVWVLSYLLRDSAEQK